MTPLVDGMEPAIVGSQWRSDFTVLHVSSTIDGGAGRAARRLHDGLRRIGISSRVLVPQQDGTDDTIVGPSGAWARVAGAVSRRSESLPALFYRGRSVSWSSGWIPRSPAKRVRKISPDLVHLHFTQGYAPIGSLARFCAPLVWTLHDMWPLTGGCHYDDGCGRYRQVCGRCPQLGSTFAIDASALVLRHKLRAWRDTPLTLVAPSRWMAERARESAVFSNKRIEVIPYGIDLDRYRPIRKSVARDLLHLPQDRIILLFGAFGGEQDQRKGFSFLRTAIVSLATDGLANRLVLASFGRSSAKTVFQDLGIPIYRMGMLRDDVSIALLYSAADIFVCPSVQDNLPNTVLESLACGTPVVAFNVGGMSDMVEHGRTGYLVKPADSVELARGIMSLLSNQEGSAKMARQARAKAEREFDSRVIARRYERLYWEVLSGQTAHFACGGIQSL